MSSKKPLAVWMITFITLAHIIFLLFVTISHEITYFATKTVETSLSYNLGYILGVIIFVIPAIVTESIFSFKFFNLQKKCLIWLYISLGLALLSAILRINIITIIAILIYGWIIWDYVTHKKIDDQLVFM